MPPDKYRNEFTDARWDELCFLVRQKKMKVSFNDFTASELELIIKEAGLSENQTKGAVLFYIKKVKMNQIAVRLNYSLSTIKYYKKRVSRQLRATCCKVFK